MNNRKRGKFGEWIAKEYLIENKYKILETNFHSYIGEIDIISCKDNVLHFVEVKYRQNLEFGNPIDSVNSKKLYRMKATAKYYIYKNKLPDDIEISFDVIEIYFKKQKIL